jgi:hypothetical protein
MTINQVKILFVLNRAKTNKKELSPLICRMTFNGKRKEFSTGFYVPKNEWNAKFQIITSKTAYAKNINTHLDKIYRGILTTYSEMIVDKEAFTVNDIYRTYIGAAKDKIAYTVEYFNDYLLKIKKLVDKDMEESTWKKFENSLEHLKDFIKWKYNQQDILLNDINLFFIQEYEFYLKAIKELVNSTIHKVIQRFKKVIIHAKNEGLIQKNPFASYKSISVNKENECK